MDPPVKKWLPPLQQRQPRTQEHSPFEHNEVYHTNTL